MQTSGIRYGLNNKRSHGHNIIIIMGNYALSKTLGHTRRARSSNIGPGFPFPILLTPLSPHIDYRDGTSDE
ncbi:hypothetical protein QTP88_005585 [Uroleucon formosanum]